VRRVTLGLLAVVLLAACSAGSTPSAAPANRDSAVVVASFNFSESQLLAEIYAQALERAGIPVRRQLDLGPRELAQPAMLQGFVDVVPEYLGTALQSLEPDKGATTNHDNAAAQAALGNAVAPYHLDVLRPAAAQDQNGLVMLAARAKELGIRTTSDLARHPQFVLGGPPECPTREFCLQGLHDVYGLSFAQFMPLATLGQEQTALEQGLIDVAVMFTTDGRLADTSLVLLEDDRRLQPVENVVPIVSQRVLDMYGPRLTSALDAVSGQLTTPNLTFLNWRVDIDGKNVADEASAWLSRHSQ
jgi:osmoprotectant transport system substrate-binding protein